MCAVRQEAGNGEEAGRGRSEQGERGGRRKEREGTVRREGEGRRKEGREEEGQKDEGGKGAAPSPLFLQGFVTISKFRSSETSMFTRFRDIGGSETVMFKRVTFAGPLFS